MDNFYGNRLRSLQAVDEALESITETLDKLGLTDDTYFIYTAGEESESIDIPHKKILVYDSSAFVSFASSESFIRRYHFEDYTLEFFF
jgi:hypothetical protein